MKKNILLCLVSIILSAGAFAQKKTETSPPPQMPVDNVTKKITFSEVVEVKGITVDQLYQRTLKWFRAYYKNPTEVIRENDSVEHKITGKPRFKIYNAPDKEGTKTDGGIVQYTITVSQKDGRYKFEITDLNWKQSSNYPCERWYDKALPSYSKAYDEYIRQTDMTIRSAIADLKNAMMSDKPGKRMIGRGYEIRINTNLRIENAQIFKL